MTGWKSAVTLDFFEHDEQHSGGEISRASREIRHKHSVTRPKKFRLVYINILKIIDKIENVQKLNKNVQNSVMCLFIKETRERAMSSSESMLGKRKRIFEEWKKFQNGEDVDHSIVRDFVYRSWLRCRALHVDPFRVV